MNPVRSHLQNDEDAKELRATASTHISCVYPGQVPSGERVIV